MTRVLNLNFLKYLTPKFKAMLAAAYGGHLMQIIFVFFQILIQVILDGKQSLFLKIKERVSLLCCICYVRFNKLLCRLSLLKAIVSGSFSPRSTLEKTKENTSLNNKLSHYN